MEEMRGLLRTEDGAFLVTIRALAGGDDDGRGPKPPRRTRRTWSKTTRIQLLHAQDFRCAICRGMMGLWDTHVDHIVPLRSGGTDDMNNLQLVHATCNLRKGAGHGPYDAEQGRLPWA